MDCGTASENGFVDSVDVAPEGVSGVALGARSLPIWLGVEMADAES